MRDLSEDTITAVNHSSNFTGCCQRGSPTNRITKTSQVAMRTPSYDRSFWTSMTRSTVELRSPARLVHMMAIPARIWRG